MRISVVGPVLNEIDFIGYCIMATLDKMHEYIYSLDEKSSDGTRELLYHIKNKYAHEKLTILETPTFHPSNMKAYNAAFNAGIAKSTGDAVMFLHPDQIVTEWPEEGIPEGPLAWWVQMTSFAGDMKTVITKGRADKWKNIHAKKFGVHYFGGYGSQNEDFYHSEITGKSYKHYGLEFSKYPYRVGNSGIKVSHFCELKGYRRRLEKMKICLKELYPNMADGILHDLAVQHPRVTLEESSTQFGSFKFEPTTEPIPEVFEKYKEEFESFKTKELVHA